MKLIEYAKKVYHKRNVKKNNVFLDALLKDEDFKKVKNSNIASVKVITFVVPGIYKGSGGMTSILRIGSYLANEGYQVQYVNYTAQSEADMQRQAPACLAQCRGTFLEKGKMNQLETDVVIATSWVSVYYAKKIKGYKMYFIQDYEPYFEKFGEKFLLAKKTYEFGFHMISLGQWNKKKILHECEKVNESEIDIIEFPYSPEEYKWKERNYQTYSQRKQFKVVVYIKNEDKRLPNLIQIMWKHAVESLLEKGIQMDVLFFGMNPDDPVLVGKNLGKLDKKELEQLYQNADFGMVASMTNISLVPYEMIATGLPVIEFQDGSFTDFFPADTAILVDFSYRDLVEGIMQCLQNPHKLLAMQKKAGEAISGLGWDKTCGQFLEIIKRRADRHV